MYSQLIMLAVFLTQIGILEEVGRVGKNVAYMVTQDYINRRHIACRTCKTPINQLLFMSYSYITEDNFIVAGRHDNSNLKDELLKKSWSNTNFYLKRNFTWMDTNTDRDLRHSCEMLHRVVYGKQLGSNEDVHHWGDKFDNRDERLVKVNKRDHPKLNALHGGYTQADPLKIETEQDFLDLLERLGYSYI